MEFVCSTLCIFSDVVEADSFEEAEDIFLNSCYLDLEPNASIYITNTETNEQKEF